MGWLVGVGILVAVPGIWLVSTSAGSSSSAGVTPPGRATRAGVVDGVAAGLGFGVLFVALGQVPRTAGLVPLMVCQAVSVPVLVGMAVGLRAPWLPRDRPARLAFLTGPLGTAATGAFLLATQHGYLSIAGVLTSLYPAATVVLAAVFLRERIRLPQGIGLVLCGVSLACIAGG